MFKTPKSFVHKRRFIEEHDLSLNVVKRHLRDNYDLVQRLSLIDKLSTHQGCVNTVVWSYDGKYLLSGSDDKYLVISDPFNTIKPVIARIRSGHSSNIFSAKFLPQTDNNYIASCAGDGSVILTCVDREDTHGCFVYNCHTSTTYEVAVFPNDAYTFLTCAEDGTVRWFDRRIKTECIPCKDDVLIECSRAVCAIDVNPMKPYMLAIGCADSSVRLYDMRRLSKPTQDTTSLLGLESCFYLPRGNGRASRRVTSVDFSKDGGYLLASFSSDFVYLFQLDKYSVEPVEEALEFDDENVKKVRRVRLRGDWSDTGPDARPEHHSGDEEPPQQPRRPNSDLQRFSNLMTSFIERHIIEDSEPFTIAPVRILGNLRGAPDEASAERNQQSSVASAVEGSDRPTASSSSPQDPEQLAAKFEEDYEEEPQSELGSSTDEVHSMDAAGNSNIDLTSNNDRTLSETSEEDTHKCECMQHEFAAKIDMKLKLTTEGTCCSTMQLNVQTIDLDVLRSNASMGAVATSAASDTTVSDAGAAGGGQAVAENEEPAAVGYFMYKEGAWVPGDAVGSSATNVENPSQPGTSSQATEGDQNSPEDRRMSRRRTLLKALENEATRRKEQKVAQEKALQRIPRLAPVNVFKGHRNARTMLKQACFWGDEFILSGSDCGHIFVWDKSTAKVAMVLEGDSRVVNCLQPHPYFAILASSGIDYDIKLWASVAKESTFDEAKVNQLVKRNNVMLEETKDTVTVPASFMIRMLANMGRLRERRRAQQSGSEARNSGDEEASEESEERAE